LILGEIVGGSTKGASIEVPASIEAQGRVDNSTALKCGGSTHKREREGGGEKEKKGRKSQWLLNIIIQSRSLLPVNILRDMMSSPMSYYQ
jgi:hypothetical protein